MKSFKEFKEDAGGAGGAAAVGAASGGAVPANRTGPSVAGTVGDPPVSKKAQKAIQTQSTLSYRTDRVATKPTPSSGVSNRVGPNILETTESPRKIGTVVGFKEFRQKPTVGAGVGPQTFMTKEGLREDTKKAQKEITSANSKTHPNPTGFVKVGDTGHLGFGAKGGAGFTGTVSKIEGDLVHLTSKYNPNKTYRGHVSKFTKS